MCGEDGGICECESTMTRSPLKHQKSSKRPHVSDIIDPSDLPGRVQKYCISFLSTHNIPRILKRCQMWECSDKTPPKTSRMFVKYT